MTRFLIGLLLGLLLGIGGTAAFLITAGGGDYLVVTSPRVRELEATLKSVDQDRTWLRARLGEANDAMAKLESRFSTLAARFETLSNEVARDGGGQDGGAPQPTPTADVAVPADGASAAPAADPSGRDAPAAAP
jgi:hypothetical protein